MRWLGACLKSWKTSVVEHKTHIKHKIYVLKSKSWIKRVDVSKRWENLKGIHNPVYNTTLLHTWPHLSLKNFSKCDIIVDLKICPSNETPLVERFTPTFMWKQSCWCIFYLNVWFHRCFKWNDAMKMGNGCKRCNEGGYSW